MMRKWRRTAMWMGGLTTLACCAGHLHAETLGDGWTFRRPVQFKQITAEAPGENVAWVEFYANGTQKADGSDIRITAADRMVLPHKVLQVSRDNDLVRVAFTT